MKGKRRKTGARHDMRRPRGIVTLEDVARAAGVHYSTVSRALDPNKVWRVNEDTRKQVQAVARRMGYRRDMVASGLKRGRTLTVAVVVSDLGNPFIAPILRGIANRLESAGLMSLVGETQDDSERLERILDHLLSRRVDAIILTAARLGDGPALRRISRQGIPVVLAVRKVPGNRLPACTNDELMGGTLAAQHLLALGHRRVAQLRGPGDFSSTLERAQGFSRTVAKAGAVEVTLPSTARAATVEEGARLMRLLLNPGRSLPTAIFAHHDLLALGALAAMHERGLECPKHISLVGFHDLPVVDRVTPPLTTIRQPREELGRIAADMTLAIVNSPGQPPSSRTVAPTLVVRESTAPREPGSLRSETVRKSKRDSSK
jgi:LacI family transcriptional regulator, galactose operon repressor